MHFCYRWSVHIVLATCILFIAGSVHSGSSICDNNDSQKTTGGETCAETKWQIFKDKFQHVFGKLKYFFTNDLPHIFSKDVPEKNDNSKKFVMIVDAEQKNETEYRYIGKNLEAELRVTKVLDACGCYNSVCGCCQHLEEPSIHLNSTICANATYLSEDIGISVTVTVNGYAIFNETVSVRNPPPVCLGVPYVKEWAEACVRFYDIDATRSHLHACVQVEARMKHVLIAKYELGCFDVGPVSSKTNQNKEQLEKEQPFVLLV